MEKRKYKKVYSTDLFKSKPVNFNPVDGNLCPEHEPLSQTIGFIKLMRDTKARQKSKNARLMLDFVLDCYKKERTTCVIDHNK